MVSVIIAARNEEKNIRRRIHNILDQDYAKDKMEIIIVSDGSTDATNDIVREFIPVNQKGSYSNPDVPCTMKLIELDETKGKANALNIGIQQATGEFIVFADARQDFERNAIKELVANFNDQSVGCVSGELLLCGGPDTSMKREMREMGLYWNFEKTIRKMEAAIHSAAGATGAIYAIRRWLFTRLPEETLLDDVFVPMGVVFKGYRTVFDGQAIAYDTYSEDLSQEKRRKIRTLLGNYQLLQIMPGLLSPRKNPIFFRYLTHKVFRLFIPFFFLVLLFSALMAEGFIYKLAFVFGIIILLLSLFDKVFSPFPYLRKMSTVARTFVSLNYFAFLAFFAFIFWGKKKVW